MVAALLAPQAGLILFAAPKIKFIDASGRPGPSPAQGTSLLAVGAQGCAAPASSCVEEAWRFDDSNNKRVRPWPSACPAMPALPMSNMKRSPGRCSHCCSICPDQTCVGPVHRGSGKLIDTLLVRKINAYGTEHDFLTINEPPFLTDAIITNPPYGENRRGEMAVAFIDTPCGSRYRMSRCCCATISTARSPASICFVVNRASLSSWCC